MKKWVGLFLLLGGLMPTSAQTGDIEKHALIFAIGNYPPAGGWPQISSVRDIEYIKKTLYNQGFEGKNIQVVSDAEATLEGIKKSFTDLIDRVHPGDIVVIHFSSHGEQVEADNNNKMDGLDECVVTYNAISPFRSTDFQKDQAGYLRGYVIGNYLLQLRNRLGKKGDVVVFMDNCHSGDGTRGAAIIRGGAPPFVSPHFDPKKHVKSDSSIVYRSTLAASANESDLSSFEVFSATRPEELDYETIDETTGQGVGSLTYAISKAFEDLREGTAYPTYRALFARIQAIMNVKAPQQTPLLEGNGSDRILFGGRFIHQAPYLELTTLDKKNKVVTIKAGVMAGLDVGATIGLYPAGTVDTSLATLWTTGTIIQAGNFLSTAHLDSMPPISKPSQAWAFVRSHIYKIEPLNISINTKPAKPGSPFFTLKSQALIKDYLSRIPWININEKDRAELKINKGKNEDSIIVCSNGYLFSTLKNALVDSIDLREKLENYARYKFIQSLHGQIAGVEVEVRLVPVKDNKPDTMAMKVRTVNNIFEAYENDTLTLWIKNTGTRDAFINILDMQPNGIINPILPNTSLKYPIYPHDLKIIAGGEYFLPQGDVIVIGPPYGTEVFKIFASPTEIDLENIANNTRGALKDKLSVIEQLLHNSYEISRGAPISNSSNADASTNEIFFSIKPRPSNRE